MVFYRKNKWGGGGNRDGRNESTKVHFDSPVKVIEKKKKAA